MTTSPPARRRLSSSPFRTAPEPEVTEYEVNDLVSHDSFGMGRIVTVSTEAVTVDFNPNLVRVVRPFAKLSKL